MITAAVSASFFVIVCVRWDTKQEWVILPCSDVNQSTRLLRFLREQRTQVPGDDQLVMWFYRPEQRRLLGAHCKGQRWIPVCVMVHTTDRIIHQQVKAKRTMCDCVSEHVCCV